MLHLIMITCCVVHAIFAADVSRLHYLDEGLPECKLGKLISKGGHAKMIGNISQCRFL